MKTAIESAKAAFDKLKAAVLRARQRSGAKTTAAILPYSQWADLPRRPGWRTRGNASGGLNFGGRSRRLAACMAVSLGGRAGIWRGPR